MDPMRLILIAVGGYFLYTYYQKQQQTGIAPGPVVGGGGANPPVGTVNPGGTAAGGTNTTQPIVPGNTAPPVVPAATVTQATLLWNGDPATLQRVGLALADAQNYVIMHAAAGDADAINTVAAAGIRYTVDQWNYYRGLLKSPVPTELMDGMLNPNVPRDQQPPISINEYLSLLHGVGLSGLGYSSSSASMGLHYWA